MRKPTEAQHQERAPAPDLGLPTHETAPTWTRLESPRGSWQVRVDRA